ncbi:MAG: hypothetical protein M1495_00680 [Bacteroidetes bacterium]|nr:hypothetical protein [Bacteroidota bacterium]
MNSNLSSNTKLSELTIAELKEIISESVAESIQDYFENLEALSSNSYLKSIKEAREEYRTGKTVNLEDLDNV